MQGDAQQKEIILLWKKERSQNKSVKGRIRQTTMEAIYTKTSVGKNNLVDIQSVNPTGLYTIFNTKNGIINDGRFYGNPDL